VVSSSFYPITILHRDGKFGGEGKYIGTQKFYLTILTKFDIIYNYSVNLILIYLNLNIYKKAQNE